MEKIQILPEDLYRFQASSDLVSKTKKATKKLEWTSNQKNLTSNEKFLHTLEDFHPLRNWILECLQEVRADLDLDCEKLDVSIMWANKTNPGQWHHKHNHNFSYASGIFFLNKTNSQTWFSKPRYWQRDGLFTFCPESERTHVVHKYSPTPGELVIFPSSLEHSVDEHTLDFPRYSISFNAVPAGPMGRYNSAAFVNYQVIPSIQ